jgi:hypothetical protein
MHLIEGFSLEQHAGPYEKWPALTRLYFHGADTGTRVRGYVVDGQYRCAQGYLLILSFDCMFEEANEFVLLGPTFKALARRMLGAPYSTFLIEAHWPVAADALMTRYGADLFYRVSIQRGWFGRWKIRLQAQSSASP